MAWQVLAIWIIVVPVVVSFFRRESQIKQALAWANRPRAAVRPRQPGVSLLQPRPAVPMARPAVRTGGLSQSQRTFLNAMLKAS